MEQYTRKNVKQKFDNSNDFKARDIKMKVFLPEEKAFIKMLRITAKLLGGSNVASPGATRKLSPKDLDYLLEKVHLS